MSDEVEVVHAAGLGQSQSLLNGEKLGVTLPLADHESTLVDASLASCPCGVGWSVPACIGGASMAEQQTASCPECCRMILPEDTIVYRVGVLGHLDCRQPRLLSAEERTILLMYCRDHPVAACARCGGKFNLYDVASLDHFGVRSHGCPRCHTDLTDSIRVHLYGCARLPGEVRRRAQAARDAAQILVKRSLELRDAADVTIREAEAAVYALRRTIRESPRRRRGG